MRFLKRNNYELFTYIILVNFLFILLAKYLLNEEELIIESYREYFGNNDIEKLITFHKKWEWLGYAIIPLTILIRSCLVTFCLSIGMFFYDMENKLKFKQFFRIALFGEFVLMFIGFVKIFYFLLIKTEYTLEDIQQYYPLSYINFLDIKNLEPWLIYPLQTINLFEIGYFFVLVYGIHNLLQNKYWKSFEMVAVSYGTGLAIWVGFVMFLTLNIT